MDSCRLQELAAVHASTLIALMPKLPLQILSRINHAWVAIPLCLTSIAARSMQSAPIHKPGSANGQGGPSGDTRTSATQRIGAILTSVLRPEPDKG